MTRAAAGIRQHNQTRKAGRGWAPSFGHPPERDDLLMSAGHSACSRVGSGTRGQSLKPESLWASSQSDWLRLSPHLQKAARWPEMNTLLQRPRTSVAPLINSWIDPSRDNARRPHHPA